jgi:hypothetical protein
MLCICGGAADFSVICQEVLVNIKPGIVLERNGIAIHVHSIKNGQVYFQRWPKNAEHQGMFVNLYRMTIKKFLSQITDNNYKK